MKESSGEKKRETICKKYSANKKCYQSFSDKIQLHEAFVISS